MAASARDQRLADVLLIASWTGLRWSELREVRVRDFVRVPLPVLLVSRAAPEGVEAAAQPTHGAREPAKSGKLSINTRPWSTVYLGSRMLGTTPLASVTVPRGTLTLKLVDRDGQVHLRRLARSRATERTAFYDFAQPKPAKRTKRR